jgi:hypothetical protein
MNIQSALVLSILKQWRSYQWTQQGFGFLRTKIENVGRIHVWDSSLATRYVSSIHTHPWSFESTIISGELINQKYLIGQGERWQPNYQSQCIATGEGGGLLNESKAVCLIPEQPELYTAGMFYRQESSEIHRTIAQDGTVTLLTRPQGPPLEEATVFWPIGTHWVSAEPVPAAYYNVQRAIEYAIARWSAA